MKFTNRAQKALEEATSLAANMKNTTVEPEHLLRAIARERSILNKTLSDEEMRKLIAGLDAAISEFARVSGGAQTPQLSYSLAQIVSNANKKTQDYISVPLLLLYLFEDKRAARHTSKAEDVKRAVAEFLGKNEMSGLNSDDPDDKMSQFAVEMVEQARKNKYDPVIGRDDEIRQVIEILAKKTKSNVIMVGKPGVGKTAIVNGIAQLIARGESPILEGYKIYSVDVGSMVAGSSLRGEFEERLKGLVKEAENNPKVILFMDEIHIVLGAGKADGSLDAANILKPGLADGSLRVIGATTYDEYRRYVTKDPAFERRFTRVNVREPSVADTITIMRGLRERLEMHHGVKIADRALVYASQMGKRFIPNRRLPDVAIDLVDTACASAIITLNSEPKDISDLRRKIWSLELEKTSLEMDIGRAGSDAELIASLQSGLGAVEEKLALRNGELRALEDAYNAEKGHVREARELKQKLEDAKNRMEQAQRENNRYLVYDLQTNIIPIYEKKLAEYNDKVEVIDVGHVMEIISRLSGVPVSKIGTKESEKLLTMEDTIKDGIFGQDHAVRIVCDCIMSAKAGLGSENRPIGSFLFLGPTGVGKTELSKAVCRELNGTCENMVVLDMSDYASEISLNKLIGAPAGYVGCEEGGSLTEPVKEMPYTVVLLDEVDLAHQSVLNVLYQLLDEGRVTDGRGVRVSFRDTVVIMTSNLGQEYIHETHHEMNKIEELVIRRFGHPLINRIDNIVTFNHLSPDALSSILDREIADVNRRLSEKKASLVISDAVSEYAIGQAVGSGYGARILRRFVKDHFIGVLTRIVLSRHDTDPYTIRVFMISEGIEGSNHGMFTFVAAPN